MPCNIMNVKKKYTEAIKLLQAGQLQSAELAFGKIIEKKPNHAASLHKLSLIKGQQNLLQEAHVLLSRSLQFSPKDPYALNDMGLLMIALGEVEQAEKMFRASIKVAPKFPDSSYNLANLYSSSSRNDLAVPLFEKAVKLVPDVLEPRINLAHTLQKLGLLDKAEKHYQIILKTHDGYLPALKSLSNIYLKTGRENLAIEMNEKLLANDTGQLDILVNHILLLYSTNDQLTAEKYLNRLRESVETIKDPEKVFFNNAMKSTFDIGSHVNCSDMYILLENFEKALKVLNYALEIQPKSIDALKNRISVYEKLEYIDKAEADSRTLLELMPDTVQALLGLSYWLNKRNELTENEMLLTRVLEIEPENVIAIFRLAMVRKIQKDWTGETDYLKKVISIDPEYALAHTELGMVYLLDHQWDKGWKEQEWRQTNRTGLDYAVHPLHENQVLARPSTYKSIDYSNKPNWMVTTDEGLGDELLYLRFADQLYNQGVCLKYKAPKKLEKLLKRHTFTFEQIDEVDPSADRYLLTGELGMMCDYQKLPTGLRLTSCEGNRKVIQARLEAAGPPPYIAFTWEGGTKGYNFRQINLDKFAETVKDVDGTFISVQRNPEPEATQRLESLLGKQLHDFSDINDDLENALAIMDLVDEYIGITNTNMNLRESLGKTARALVSLNDDWRWGKDGKELVWFPSFNIYRETSIGWDDALKQLQVDLKVHSVD